MTARDIIADALAILGKDEEYDYETMTLDDVTIKRLFFALNHILSELSEIIGIKVKEEATVSGGRIDFSALSKRPYKMIRITQNGRNVSFRERPKYAEVTGGLSGVAEAEYYMRLNTDELDNEIETPSSVDIHTISLGIASEYCMANSMPDDAVAYEQKYKQALSRAIYPGKRVIIKCRRWI